LRVTRELASEMESEEALAKRREAARDHEELQKLRDTAELLKDEVKSLTVRNSTYMHERDMFRRMLQQKASAAENAAALGVPTEGSQREVLASIEQNSVAGEEPDYATMLRELQANFDAYRNEESVDRTTLREQAQKLSGEKNTLQTEIARIH